ncbi:MAG: MFS transporter [Alphaproteobacteria bacterium]|nr:MFS transporter [Alphaproteobacteria bacterium]
MADAANAPAGNVTIPDDVKRHRTYALIILTLIYMSSHLDRSIVGILAQPIKDELGLSDTQVGFLGGFAFAVFYATLGIPLALLADRTNRRNIIAFAVTVWSVMTVACGFAGNYLQLVLARIGVGVGEAGSSPQSHSMIADMYAPHERSRAMSVYTLGVTLGVMLGFMVGGYVSTHWGWRTAFFVAGAPGLILGVIVWLTVREPQRGLADGLAPGARKPQTFGEAMTGLGQAFVFIWQSKAARHVVIGLTLTSFVGYGVTVWGASFLERTHHIPRDQIGLVLGPIAGIAGGFGTVLGGYLADRLSRRDLQWTSWIIAVGKFGAAPMVLGFYALDNFTLAILFYLPAAVLGAFYLGPSFAIVQSVAPVAMRATAAAITLFILNFIALGLGPLFVGILSDALKATYGSESLRYALMVTSLINVWAGYHFFLAGPAYKREMTKAA